MLDAGTLVITALAVARIVRLLGDDTIAQPVRARLRPRLSWPCPRRPVTPAAPATGSADQPAQPDDTPCSWAYDDSTAMHYCTHCRAARQSRLLQLITCPWCLSIWVAAALVPLAMLTGGLWCYQLPATILALSAVTGYAAAAYNALDAAASRTQS